MSPLFYEDSLGAKLAEKMREASDRVREIENEYIDDPEELERAETATHGLDTTPNYDAMSDDWVVVFGPSKVSGFLDVAGANAMMITMPLDAEGVAYCWDPYHPQDMPGATMPAEHAADRPFSLLVAPDDAVRARELLAGTHAGSRLNAGLPAAHDLTQGAQANRRALSAMSLFVMYGLGLVSFIIIALFLLLGNLLDRF